MQRQFYDKIISHLISMSPDNKNGSLGGMAGDRGKPKVKSCMLVTQSNVPQ